MTWMTDTAILLAGRGENHCDAGHDSHDTIQIQIDLSEHTVPDVPVSTGRMLMNLYDWATYHGIPCYCPANDEVSFSIATQGIWEGFETCLALDILRQPGLVLDFGANLGWYSTLAALADCEVLAVEADEENVEVLVENARLNNVEDRIVTCRGWIGADTPAVSAGPRIRFLKSDVEGAENHVMRVCEPLFAAGLVDYALLEVSPIFGDHYPAIIAEANSFGYDSFLVPDKGFSPTEFANDPIGSTRSTPIRPGEIVPELRQRSVLLVGSEQ